jgi:plastocyanin
MALGRKVALAAALDLLLILIPATPATASGGGGCGRPVTNETGTGISIYDYCFLPTVLYADPGDTITWTNSDATPHSVAGANMAWGSFESFDVGRAMSYSFPKSGVYSYVCTLHPGMVGTVVVGDAAPAGTSGADRIRRVEQASATVPEPVESEGPVLLVAALGLVMIGGALGARGIARRARR